MAADTRQGIGSAKWLSPQAARLAEHNCYVVAEIGPDTGSRLQLIFASTKDVISRLELRKRLDRIRDSLRPAVKTTKTGMMIAVIVGNGMIAATGGPKDAAETFHVPQAIVEVVYHAGNIGTTASGIREVIDKKRKEEAEAKKSDGAKSSDGPPPR